MPQDRERRGGGALGSVVLASLAIVTLLCAVALVVALCVVGSGLSGRMDESDQRVGVLLQRITDLEAENDYLFEEREGEGEDYIYEVGPSYVMGSRFQFSGLRYRSGKLRDTVHMRVREPPFKMISEP